MNLLPSRRLLLLLVAATPLFLLSNGIALAADALILAAAVLDVFLLPAREQLRVRRECSSRLSLGGETEVRILLESTATRPLHLRLTDDLSPGLVRQGDDVFDLDVPPRDTTHVTYRMRAEERGLASLGDVHLRLLGPLELVWRQRRIRCTNSIRVQPGLREIRRHRLLAHQHRLREMGLRAMRERGEGTSFESLREYIRGDDPRRIDWKATARRGTLILRQFEAERSQNVLLAIDAGRLMTEQVGDRERLDHALAAALLLADVAKLGGDRVGVFVFAERIQQFLPPARLPLDRIATALAHVEARLVEPDYPAAFTYLARQLRRRSLLVLFTDIIDARTSSALLAHLGTTTRRHLPLVIAMRNPGVEAAATAPADRDAGIFHRVAAEELLQARAHALATMQRAGILVADTHPRDIIPAVVNRYLEVKRKGLL